MNDVLPELSNVTISKVHVQDSDSIIEINTKRGMLFFFAIFNSNSHLLSNARVCFHV